ncbi:protodermal factor 1-like [Zingiber officinale]|uniref:Protodermal factor 1 n=1 Tax=Zingiber officinale TaxID=94328 RepID=A0A8J5G8K8_ZINOF|nr:protodermal factor 1-like [Zingiber officinale]KAG6494005.1 hypothetical protein ZIOFF_049021 [Zingiber officinale]
MKKMMCFLVICLASQALTQSTSRSLQDSHGECPPSGAGVPSSHGTPPSGGGGGGHYNPPSSNPPVVVPTPTTPVVVGPPGTPTYGAGPGVPSSHGAPPSGGGGGGYYNPPSSSTPVVVPTPTTPVVVGPPATPTYPLLPPGTPFIPIDPNCPPPFTCDYWRTHPNAIWALFGFWCPLVQIFGLPNPAAFATTNPTLLDALANTRRDGIGELYREATAAFLNSLADRRFYFTGQQVRDSFRAALGSDQAALAQAQVFKLANEGRLKRH